MTAMENAEIMKTIKELREAVQALGANYLGPHGVQLYWEIEYLIKKLEEEIAK